MKLLWKILLATTMLLSAGVVFQSCIARAYAPSKITVTQNYITTNDEFTNGVAIEKIQVDSVGAEGYPLHYTVVYTTQCNREAGTQKKLKKIEFAKPGSYTWNEDTIATRYVHKGLSRRPLDPISKTWWLQKFGNHPVCPIRFEKKKWYFITVGNPQVTGIFFYIDEDGKEKQFYLKSGVSPI